MKAICRRHGWAWLQISEGRAETEVNKIRENFNRGKSHKTGKASKRKNVHSWTARGKVQLWVAKRQASEGFKSKEQLKLVQNRETPLTLMEFVNVPLLGVKPKELNNAASFCVPHTDSHHPQVWFTDQSIVRVLQTQLVLSMILT